MYMYIYILYIIISHLPPCNPSVESLPAGFSGHDTGASRGV